MKRILTALIAAAVMVASIQMAVFADDTVPADNEQVTAAEFQQEENPETPEQGTGITEQGKDDGLPDKDDLSHDEFQPEEYNKENTTEGENLKQNVEGTRENDFDVPEESKITKNSSQNLEKTSANTKIVRNTVIISSEGWDEQRNIVAINKEMVVDISRITSVSKDSLVYTWYSAEKDRLVEEANTISYTPTEDDIGKTIVLRVFSPEAPESIWESNFVTVRKYYSIHVTRKNISGIRRRYGKHIDTEDGFNMVGWTGDHIQMTVWTGQRQFKGWFLDESDEEPISKDFTIDIVFGQEEYEKIDRLCAVGSEEFNQSVSTGPKIIRVKEGYQTAKTNLRITNKSSKDMNLSVSVDNDEEGIFSVTQTELIIKPDETGRIDLTALPGKSTGDYSCYIVVEDAESGIHAHYEYTLSVNNNHKNEVAFDVSDLPKHPTSVYNGKDQAATAAKNSGIVPFIRSEHSEIELTEDNFEFLSTVENATIKHDPDNKDLYWIDGKDYRLARDVGRYKIWINVKPNHPDYYGAFATFIHEITPAPVSIKFGETQFTYDGTPKAVTATYIDVNGEEKPAEVTYNGETAAPSASGTYTVKASIPDKNYMVDGTDTTTLKISSTAQEPVTPSTPDDKPSNPSTSTTDDDNDDDSSSSGSSASVNTPVYGDGTTTSGRTINVTSSAISSVVGKAASSGTTARIYIADTAAISKSVLNGMKAPVTFTAPNYAVTFDPAKMNERVDVKFSIKTSAPSAQNTFEKYFKEPVAAVSCAQKGSFGGTVCIDIKPDKLGNINTSKTMYVYSWNAAANSYKKVGSAVLLKNGRIRCYTDRGYDLIVSNADGFTLK